MGVVFISGSYGVGKTTVCTGISHYLGIPSYSASELISNLNNEKYGVNKLVSDIDLNQYLLSLAVEKALADDPIIIVDGHSCLLDQTNNVVRIPYDSFSNLHLKCIVLLKSDPSVITTYLNCRDDKKYQVETISLLQDNEEEYLKVIANDLNIPMFVYNMEFSNKDIETIANILKDRVFDEGTIRY